MPILHRNWKLLGAKLVNSDPLGLLKRVGENKTLAIEVEELVYDPSIPILREYELDKWIKSKKKLLANSNHDHSSHPHLQQQRQQQGASCSSEPPKTLSRQPSVEVIAHEGLPTEEISKRKRHESKSKPKHSSKTKSKNPNKHHKTSKPSPRQGVSAKENHNSASIQTEPEFEVNLSEEDLFGSQVSDLSSSSGGSAKTKEALGKCETDELVINEPIDDEYAKFEDDDFAETEISKNLKKIRTIQTNSPAIHVNPRPVILLPPNMSTTPRSMQETAQSKKRDRSESPPPMVKVPQKPEEPDWPETVRQLQSNQFLNVFKDLNHFKSRIKNDEAAKSLPKEMVMKCVQEDETHLLIDALNLVYELNYDEDINFWSELVQRLKRKLNKHSQVRNFKTKTDPKIVYENYDRALRSLSEYAKAANLTMTIPFHTMLFLIEPLMNSDQISNTNGAHAINSKTATTDPAAPSSNEAPISISAPESNDKVLNNDPPAPPPSFITDIEQPLPAAQSNATSEKPQQVNGCTVNGGKTNFPVKCKVEPSIPLEPLKFNVFFPDLKPKIKFEKQEIVDIVEKIERRITSVKDSSGHVSFKITRRKNPNTKTVFKHRL